MAQLKKLTKNRQFLLDIVKKAPNKVKSQQEARKSSVGASNEEDYNENLISLKFFCEILDYISQENEIECPSIEEKYTVFEEFNKGKEADFITRDQYQIFMNRISDMLKIVEQANNTK